MFATKLFKAVVLIISISTAAQAQEVWGKGGGVSYSMAGIEGGFRWNSADVTGATSNKQVIGFQIGGSAVFDFAENFGVKTGLFYTERPFKYEIGTTASGSGKISYFDVPVLAMFKFADYAGVYVGPSFAIKLGDEISTTPSGGTLTDIKGTLVPITFGAQFKMTPGMGVNLFFETVSGDLAQGLKNSRAVGANVLFTFD